MNVPAHPRRMRKCHISRARAAVALRPGTAGAAVLAAGLGAGCGGSPTAPAQDQVFYLHGGSAAADCNAPWETHFEPLDALPTERTPRMAGVGVMNGDVRLSRPLDWYVRAADYTREHRFISYQSPRQFLFSIYERVDSPEDTWPDVERRFEADVVPIRLADIGGSHARGDNEHTGARISSQDAGPWETRPSKFHARGAHPRRSPAASRAGSAWRGRRVHRRRDDGGFQVHYGLLTRPSFLRRANPRT